MPSNPVRVASSGKVAAASAGSKSIPMGIAVKPARSTDGTNDGSVAKATSCDAARAAAPMAASGWKWPQAPWVEMSSRMVPPRQDQVPYHFNSDTH